MMVVLPTPGPPVRTSSSAIAREFGMVNGRLVVSIRRALLFYLLDEMRLLSAVRKEDSEMADVPIWLKNAREIASELANMEIES
jgi:hypothetical protein